MFSLNCYFLPVLVIVDFILFCVFIVNCFGQSLIGNIGR